MASRCFRCATLTPARCRKSLISTACRCATRPCPVARRPNRQQEGPTMAKVDEVRAKIAAFEEQLEQFRKDAGRALYTLRRGGEPYSGGQFLMIPPGRGHIPLRRAHTTHR